jgi:hypothetical protein
MKYIKIINNKILEVSQNEDYDFIFEEVKLRSRNDAETIQHIETLQYLKSIVDANNKKLVIICYGDLPPVIFPNDKNVIIYKNSIDFYTKPNNEFGLGCCVDDKFDGTYLDDNLISIGFVGHEMYNRKKYIDMFMRTSFKKNFIVRPWNFFDVCKKQKNEIYRKEFFDNLKDNMFTFCYRGRGNFSVRFYETLMMGRIPIVIDSKITFPFPDKINMNFVSIFIDELELENHEILESKISEFINKNNLLEIQKNNRKIYEEYFSPNTFKEKILLDAYDKIVLNFA